MSGYEDLRALLRAEINTSAYTQAELCQLAGISEKHLSQFLTGSAGMSLDVLDRFLAVLDRSLVVGTRPL